MPYKIWIAPAVANVNITLYRKQNSDPGTNGYNVWYSTNGCSSWTVWTAADCNVNTSCVSETNVISVPQNTTVYVYVEDCGTSAGISFNAAADTTTCPSGTANYCDDGTCLGTPWSFSSGTSSTKDVAITVYTSKFGYLTCV